MAITKSIRKKKRNNSRRKIIGGEHNYDYGYDYDYDYDPNAPEGNDAQLMRVRQEQAERERALAPHIIRAAPLMIQRHQEDLQKLAAQIGSGGIIYICCLLDDLVIVDFLKYIVERNRTSGSEHIRVWLQINPYNAGVKGGTPWIKYRDDFFKLLRRVDESLTTMAALNEVGIYAVNPTELNNIDNIENILTEYNTDRKQEKPSAFGINKLYKLLSKQEGIDKQNETNIIFMTDPLIYTLKASNDSSDELKALVILFNTIVDKIASVQSLPEWKTWVKEKNIKGQDLLSKLEQYKTLIVGLGDMEKPGSGAGTYTQILKLLSSIKGGPQLPNDWIGMMVAAYIMTNNNSNEPEVFDPVGPNAKIVPGQTDFMNYLSTNWEKIKDNKYNFPDMIIHDGEEDDILTVQFAKRIAKRENRDLLTAMQTSPTNQDLEANFKKISGNVNMISFLHFDSITRLPKNMDNAKKVRLAIEMCVKSDIWKENCFTKQSVSTGGLSKKLHNYHKKYTSKKRYKKIRTIKKKRARKF